MAKDAENRSGPDETALGMKEALAYSDDECRAAADGLQARWSRQRHPHYESVVYDKTRKVFALQHRQNGEVTMSARTFMSVIEGRLQEQVEKMGPGAGPTLVDMIINRIGRSVRQ